MPPLTELTGSDILINMPEKILIKNLDVYSREQKIVLEIKPERFLSAEEAEEISEHIKKKYGIRNVQVVCDYSETELTQDELNIYSGYILGKIYTGNLIYKCALLNSVWKLNGNGISIFLKTDCNSLIENAGLEKRISDIIKKETGRHFQINFIKSTGDTAGSDIISERLKVAEKAMPVIVEKSTEIKAAPLPEVLPINADEIETGGVIRGKKITDKPIPIATITGEMNSVTICGDILSVEQKELKSGRILVSFAVTDFTSSIKIKLFEGAKEDAPEERKQRAAEKLKKITDGLKSGQRVLLKGRVQYDDFDKELLIMGSDIMKVAKEERMDNAEKKRVELHMHTQMSTMDGVTSVKDLVKRAMKWGHTAIAVTDHGVVQAFPDAFNTARDEKDLSKYHIKILYGVEGYLRAEDLNIVFDFDKADENNTTIDAPFVVFDLETTGFSPIDDRIIEIGAVKIENGNITERFSTFVNPQRPIPEKITELTSITDGMVSDAPLIDTAAKDFIEFSKGCIMVAHNASFDMGFMRANAERLGLDFDFCYMDTLELCRAIFTDQKRHGLAAMVKRLNIVLENHHRAVDDAEATAEVLKHCFTQLRERNIINIDDINSGLAPDDKGKMKYHHIIIFAKNPVGLEHLYRIISASHLEYFYKKPIMPRSLINKYREGLIIGSACEAGELYRAVLNGKKQKEIDKIAEFYDYLEIQPDGNNEFLVRNGRVSGVNRLHEINRRIIETGKRLGKLTVATGDVHFMDPQDEAFRRILMDAQGFEDADNQAPLYFRTTEEMLDEFAYLGKDLAYEVVVENTNKIADMMENIQLLPDEPHTPSMDGAEEDIVNISMNKAYEIYGDPLPEIVKARIDRELGSIIKHGFSVLYIIAQKLVWHSNGNGYLVGSRGSVGSSFIAFLLGITEVNALQPHYVCPKCKHSEFITDGSVDMGMDMDDKNCPICGTKYNKNGYDIPFETFLGFDGDKEPDIDLNFSGDDQPNAHKHTEELFGKGHTFRAGTIGTVAEKTAYGYVMKYMEKRGLHPSAAEIDRLTQGCTGVKRTTGQHPGGIMVVPRAEDIHSFCPIQHPADDTSSDIITTHFDYHSISGRLLKLDILGHDDPTVIRMLEDLTGIDSKTIEIGEKETMSIFTGTEALGVTPEQIKSPVGTYGVPEFGTSFVRKMLVDTKPTTITELIRISGLSHGTDVWLNNAQDLVQSGTITLKEAICTRDDIMTYLIYHGVEKKMAFTIMEYVRKGKAAKNGMKPEFEEALISNNIPQWYIDSCKKIKYMFPKAHAAAYVMMAFRIAWFKVHHAKEYYSTYLSVRGEDFDAGLMIGKENVEKNFEEYRKMDNPSVKDKGILTLLEMCNEMYARGISFETIDLYKSHASRFMPTESGNILPPLSAIPGLGKNAAEKIVEEREKGEFFNIQDLRERAKVSKSVIQLLKDHHCLDGMPETAQLTLF